MPKSRNKFTNEDDVALIKGILKYGVSWAKIYHDEEFPFVNGIRDSTLALRDRCRNRFPVVYKYLYDHQVDDQQKVEYLHHMRMALTAANWNLEAHGDTSVLTTRSGAKMMNIQSNYKRFGGSPSKNADANGEPAQHDSIPSSPKSAAAAAAAATSANQADSENAMDMNAAYYAYPMEYYQQFSHEQLMGHAEQNSHANGASDDASTTHSQLQAMMGGMAGAPDYHQQAAMAAAAAVAQAASETARESSSHSDVAESAGSKDSSAPVSIPTTVAVVSSEAAISVEGVTDGVAASGEKEDSKIAGKEKPGDDTNASHRFESIGGLAGVASAALELEQIGGVDKSPLSDENTQMVTPQDESAQFTFARKKGAALPNAAIAPTDAEAKKKTRRPMITGKKI